MATSGQMGDEDSELLARYACGSHEAFEALVHRHADLVWSSALRLVGGDRHLAEDVAQVVFTALAVKAPRLKPGVILPGWLLTATRFAAADLRKSEGRRKRHERNAAMASPRSVADNTAHGIAPQPDADPTWARVAPILDESLSQLGESLRLAVVLRFFERKTMREVAGRLGISEEAARQRVCRGLEKLRQALGRKSVVVPAAALGTLLAARAVEAAPVGVATTLASAASVASAAGVKGLTSSGGAFWMLAGCVKGSAAACVVVSLLGSVAVLVAWELGGRAPEETVRLAAPAVASARTAPSATFTTIDLPRPQPGPAGAARKTLRIVTGGGPTATPTFELSLSAPPAPDGPSASPGVNKSK